MSEEKELQELDLEDDSELTDFVDFSDLEDFDSASNQEMFGELGDIADLGDVPDLSAIEEAPIVTEEAETAVPELEQISPDVEMEIPIPDINEEAVADEEVSVPEILEEELLQGLDTDDELDFKSVEPAKDVPDIFDVESDDDIFAEGTSGMEEVVSDLPDDMTQEDVSVDLPGGLAMEEESADMVLEEDASLMNELDTTAVLDEEPDVGLEADILGGLDLDFSAEEEEETPLAVEESGEDGLDSMLGGLLDNLDMNGSIEEPAASEEMPMEEADSMTDLLGLDDTSFAEEGMEEGDMQDMLDVAGMMPESSAPEEEKNPGFLKKVFGNVITDEIAEQERAAAQKAEEEAAQKAEEEAQAKEEAEARKAEKAAAKEAKKAEKQKEKEAKKAEKAARKAEKKAKREEEEAAELEVVGKLNKVGVSIIVIATILFLSVEIAGTNLFSYISTKKEALDYFDMGKYTEAYQEAIGTNMREKDEEEYNKIKVVMKVQQSLNAYQNYDRIKYYPEALDALLRGIKRYDANIEQAMELEVDKDMMSCRKQILSLLKEEFNLSEKDAYALISLDRDAYQKQVIDMGLKKK